jgi:hypothetical protein
MDIRINDDAKEYINEKTKDNAINIVIVNAGSG